MTNKRHLTDNYLKPGAEKLAETIARYWIARGFPRIRVAAYRLGDDFASLGGGDWYGVRSNIGPKGFPPH